MKKITLLLVVLSVLSYTFIAYAGNGACNLYNCRCSAFTGKKANWDNICICGHQKYQHR